MARITDLLAAGRTFSFEFFPPKDNEKQALLTRTISDLQPLRPSFVSVTYRADGYRARGRPASSPTCCLETHIDPGAALAASILVAYLAGALPFVFASWIVVRSLREDPAHAGLLYSADLAGAAAGSLLAFAGLPWLGAPGLYREGELLSKDE